MKKARVFLPLVCITVICVCIILLMYFDHNASSESSDKLDIPDYLTHFDDAEKCPSDFLYEQNEDGTVTITKYVGSGGYIIIPAEIDGLTVFAVGNTFKYEGAFQECTGVTSVIISEVIAEIQDNAFYSCSDL